MKYSKFTYQKSGVNIQSADKFVEFLRKNTGQKNDRFVGQGFLLMLINMHLKKIFCKIFWLMFPTIVNLFGILPESNNDFGAVNRTNLTILTHASNIFAR